MARITLDLEALVADGRLSAEEATRLEGMAAPGRGISTIVQLLYVFGALGLAGGVMALKPEPLTGMVLAALAIGFAVVAQATKREDIGLLGTALGISGAIGLCGSFGLQFGEQLSAFTVNAVVAAILLLIALLLRSRFLAALFPLAVAALVVHPRSTGTPPMRSSCGSRRSPSASLLPCRASSSSPPGACPDSGPAWPRTQAKSPGWC